MARAALDLGVRELAALAKVSPDTVARLERGELLRQRTIDAVSAALEAAGVIFVEENGEGPGVRLRKAYKPGDYARATQHGITRIENLGTDSDGVIRSDIKTLTPKKP
jgi:hypothetical protein